MRIVLTTVLVLVICAPIGAGAEPQPTFELKDVIPSGHVEVEILDLRLPPRAEELGKKMADSMAKDRRWFMEYTRDNAVQGQPLPYHPKFGLSEDEYREFLAETTTKERKLVVRARGKLDFEQAGNVVTLDAPGVDSPIDQIRVDLTTKRVHTLAGDLGPPKWVTSDRTDIPLGPYEGYTWRFEKGDLNSLDITTVSLDIFRLKSSGRIFWRFKDGVMEKGTPTRKADLMFQYGP
jgi:hypothetical protein